MNLKLETLNCGSTAEHGPEVIRLNAYAGRHLQFDPSGEVAALFWVPEKASSRLWHGKRL